MNEDRGIASPNQSCRPVIFRRLAVFAGFASIYGLASSGLGWEIQRSGGEH